MIIYYKMQIFFADSNFSFIAIHCKICNLDFDLTVVV